MVDPAHFQVNINAAIEMSKMMGDVQSALAAQQSDTQHRVTEQSQQKAEDVNTSDESSEILADGGGTGQSGGKFWEESEEETSKKKQEPEDPFRGHFLDITR